MKKSAKKQNYLTEEQVADRCGVDAGTVRNWRYKGKGPSFFKFGGAIRYKPEDVDSFIAASRVVHG